MFIVVLFIVYTLFNILGWHTINGSRRAHLSGCLGGYYLWERGRGLVDDGLRPEGDVVGIAFEQQSVGHAEE
jgi:hypothetical protein